MKQQQNGRRRATAVVAIAAGVALLAGGSTFALWSASQSLATGTIQSGNLALTAGTAGETSWDVSADRSGDEKTDITDGTNNLTFTGTTAPANIMTSGTSGAYVLTGHSIPNLANWSIVPGDTVALAVPYQITLTGDNLVANLTIDASKLEPTTDTIGLTYQMALFGADGKQIGNVQSIPTGTSATSITAGTFQSYHDSTTNAAGTGYVANATSVSSNGTANVTVVVFANFPSTATANMSAKDALGSISATLTQTRTFS